MVSVSCFPGVSWEETYLVVVLCTEHQQGVSEEEKDGPRRE